MSKKRNLSIEFMRFVIAVIICNCHFFIAGLELKTWFYHGYLGVEFFFLVSGFLMAKSAERDYVSELSVGERSIKFILRKIASLAIPFYLALIFAFLCRHISEHQFTVGAWISDALYCVPMILFLNRAGFTLYAGFGQTWYISAMLIAMFFSYPFLIKWKKTYICWMAPLLAIMLYGYLAHEYHEDIGDTLEYVGIVYKCVIRAIAGINLGIVCYGASRQLEKVEFSNLGKAIISILEIGCYGTVIYYMTNQNLKTRDFVMTIFLAAGILISFSQRTWMREFTEKVPVLMRKLGKASLYIYLTHYIISTNVVPLLAKTGSSLLQVYAVYVVLVAVASAALWFAEKLVRSLLPKIKNALIISGGGIS